MSKSSCRHLRHGESWTRCGRVWDQTVHQDDPRWPICGVCLRSCREQDKPQEPDPQRVTEPTSRIA